MDRRLLKKLEERKKEGTLRSLSYFEGFTDFFSNDYLGVAREAYPATLSGSTGSRLISGTTKEMLSAEAAIAEFFGSESALMFNSGYDANLGFFSSVPHRSDTVIYDELIHASVRDGIRLGSARSYSFRHNDVQNLADRLSREEGTVYVVVESVYSMDGDFAPLTGIADVCRRYGAWLVVDEAHAVGVFGSGGRGLCHESGIQEYVLARLVTFGKAYGSHGACWLGSADLINYLCNFARSFIYTTALPEIVYVHNAKVVSDKRLNERREMLSVLIAYYQEQVADLDRCSKHVSPIQVVLPGDIARTRELAQRLHQSSIAVKPVYSPTVPTGKERLRICLHAFNTPEEICALAEILRSELQ